MKELRNPGYGARYVKAKREANPREYWAKAVLNAARVRCRRLGVPYDLTLDYLLPMVSDIEVCPVLGIELDFGRKPTKKPQDNSPSIDRVRGELGYVEGNIVVVSYRANRIKNDATVDELQAVAAFYAGLRSSQTAPPASAHAPA